MPCATWRPPTPTKASAGSSSFLTVDKLKTYCLYEAASADAILAAARRANVPADEIVEVERLDPAAFA
jgi:hypothetical protein